MQDTVCLCLDFDDRILPWKEAKAIDMGPTYHEHKRNERRAQPIIMMPSRLQAAGD